MELIIAPGTVPQSNRDVMPATGTPGWATDGDPALSIPATGDLACHYNMMMAEIVQVILDAGIALDRDNWGQLSSAIQKLVAIESTRAQAAEQANASALSAETQRATTIESNLQQSKAGVDWVTDNYVGGVAPAGDTGVARLYLVNYSGADGADDCLQVIPVGGGAPINLPSLANMRAFAMGASDLTNPGSVVLPNGLRLSWGYYTTPASGVANVSFKYPFTSVCFGVWPAEANAAGAWTSGVVTEHGATSATLTGFTVLTRSISAAGVAPAACGGVYYALGI